MKCNKGLNTALFSVTLLGALPSTATVIINEIDYDQPGADTAEFVELYNTGDSQLTLDGYSIQLINGSNNSIYNTIDLSGYNISSTGFFVVCNDASLVMNCNVDLPQGNGWLQNGAPDAVALFDNTGLLDSLAYEGEFSLYTEGSASVDIDSNTIITSLSRLPTGIDTNNNAMDFGLGCITPGTANIIGSGDCSSSNVVSLPDIIPPSPVPLPSTAWLLITGLLGMVGTARHKT